MRTQCDALFELPQLDRIELLIQFGLAHQEDLQQFFVCSLEVREQTDLFQNVSREMMGFVDHEHGGQLFFSARDHIMSQLQQEFALALACGRQSEIAGYVLQKLNRSQQPIKNVGVLNVMAVGQQLQQAAQQKRLARAHLPRQYHEALVP